MLQLAFAVEPINVNTATVDDFKSIGLNKKVAEAVILYRDGLKDKKFVTIEQIDEVKGVGDKTWKQIRPYLKIDPADQKHSEQPKGK